jgi:hypothetical protein
VTTTHRPSTGDRTVPTPRPDAGRDPSKDPRSTSQIVSSLTDDMTRLVRQELELAKTEARNEAARAGKGAGMLAGAGVAGHLFLVFASLSLTWLLALWMPLACAALTVALLWGVVAAVLGARGRKELKETRPRLPETQQTLKEDLEWARARRS